MNRFRVIHYIPIREGGHHGNIILDENLDERLFDNIEDARTVIPPDCVESIDFPDNNVDFYRIERYNYNQPFNPIDRYHFKKPTT